MTTPDTPSVRPEKACLGCAKRIPGSALFCRYCGLFLGDGAARDGWTAAVPSWIDATPDAGRHGRGYGLPVAIAMILAVALAIAYLLASQR